MRVALLTREYPPEVYGGAGVHVEHLARELGKHLDVGVHAFGAPRSDPLVASTHEPWTALDGDGPHLSALRTMSVDLALVAAVEGAELVHSHTWYANLAGHLSKLTYGVPHVMTTHSLEPLRPWKAEQLGGGYALSNFCERTAIEAADAIIAVSRGMRADVISAYPAADPDRVHVIYNGIDPGVYRPVTTTAALEERGVDLDRPLVSFVGRITRQKGIVHLLDAWRHVRSDARLVLAAAAPDTPAIAEEVRARVADARNVTWLDEMLPREVAIELLSNSLVFVCPSIYEPFGLVNLEAMACGAAVVAAAVGGIPEIVVDGATGTLVPFDASDDAYGTPADPDGFARALAASIDALLDDPARARRMGAAGRRRVEETFSWTSVARRTIDLYATLSG